MGSVLIPIVMYFFTDRQNKEARYVLLLLFAALITEISNETYYRLGMKGYVIANIFWAVQFFIICRIYLSLLIKKTIVYAAMMLLTIAIIVDSIFFQSINEYQGVIITLESLFLIVLAVKFAAQMIYTLPTEYVLGYYPTWLNMTVFGFFGFNFFLLALGGYIFKNTSQEVSMVFWGFHNFNNIAKNCLFAAGLYVCFVKKGKSS
jgi:hypothetical protein